MMIILIFDFQVNLLFVVDEVSDEQNGLDARATGQIFLKAMKYANWDDGSILAKITKELVNVDPPNDHIYSYTCVDSGHVFYASLAQTMPGASPSYASPTQNALDVKPSSESVGSYSTLLPTCPFVVRIAPSCFALRSTNTTLG